MPWKHIYILTEISREPRQIVGFDVATDKSPERIQAMVDNAPPGDQYYTDGYSGYKDIVYPGKYTQNIHNKNDTFTVEGINSDLRHYIPVLARRSKCFSGKLEILKAVVTVFVDAYNSFGKAKYLYRLKRKTQEVPFSVLDFF